MQTNYSASHVRDNVAKAFAKYSSFDVRLSNIQIEVDPSEQKAIATFDKTFVFTGATTCKRITAPAMFATMSPKPSPNTAASMSGSPTYRSRLIRLNKKPSPHLIKLSSSQARLHANELQRQPCSRQCRQSLRQIQQLRCQALQH